MINLYTNSCYKASKLITNQYSTSFSLGIGLFDKSIRPSIYAIYGFVRLADEVVDSFYDYNQQELFDQLKTDYANAIRDGISLNPIINSFQEVVNKYNLHPFVDAFLDSMELDLNKKDYNSNEEFENYIYGSACVVGLMCLKVFVNGDEDAFQNLKPYAMKLGAAFQKVNFLRDYNYDSKKLGRSYFPKIESFNFDDANKTEIIQNIKSDFREALEGISKLPDNSRLGVYVAYKYYLTLLKKLSTLEVKNIIEQRVRISNFQKIYILKKSVIRYNLNVL
tara:strand:+ start:51105 stop:51941 length:837 start_codon:yes stop_codon:yes gene_type:complete